MESLEASFLLLIHWFKATNSTLIYEQSIFKKTLPTFGQLSDILDIS